MSERIYTKADKKIEVAIGILNGINFSNIAKNYGWSEGLSKTSVLDKIKVARGILQEATDDIKEAK